MQGPPKSPGRRRPWHLCHPEQCPGSGVTLVGRGMGKEGMGVGGVSCSVLSRTPFLRCRNVVPLIEVHFFKNRGTIFIKQELFYPLQNESFLDCGISLIKTREALFTCDRR